MGGGGVSYAHPVQNPQVMALMGIQDDLDMGDLP